MPVNSTDEVLLDAAALSTRIETFGDALAELVDDPAIAVLVGIRTRGATLAQRLQSYYRQSRQWELPLGILDITLYRDDLSQLAAHPIVRKTELPFDVDNALILLIDDVIYTGRTVRSALDLIVDFGRPRAVKLGVLIDRGSREYPIQPDIAAIELSPSPDQVVKVCLDEDDGRDCVLLRSR